MADEADNAQFQETSMCDASVANIRASAACIPKGTPGTCYQCGEESARLVGCVCAACREVNALHARRNGVRRN